MAKKLTWPTAAIDNKTNWHKKLIIGIFGLADYHCYWVFACLI